MNTSVESMRRIAEVGNQWDAKPEKMPKALPNERWLCLSCVSEKVQSHFGYGKQNGYIDKLGIQKGKQFRNT